MLVFYSRYVTGVDEYLAVGQSANLAVGQSAVDLSAFARGCGSAVLTSAGVFYTLCTGQTAQDGTFLVFYLSFLSAVPSPNVRGLELAKFDANRRAVGTRNPLRDKQ